MTTALDSIIEKHAELTGLVAKIGSEKRMPTDEELARIQSLNSEVETVRKSWESTGRAVFLAGVRGSQSQADGPKVLKSSETLVDTWKGSYEPEYERCSIGKILKGYIIGNWDGAELEQKAMASSPTSAGGVNIPVPLAARIIDLARNNAVVMRAGAVTVPMDTATLKLARSTQDITAGWYSEAGAIAASDMAFDSVTFTARKLAALVVVNNELLEDAQGVDAAIESSIAQKLGLELDRVALVGTGTAPEPRGLQNISGINTVTSTGTPADYAKFLTAYYSIIADNFMPNAAVYSPRTAETLAKLVTGISGDKTPLTPPREWTDLTRLVSNQVPNNLGGGTNESLAFMGQWNQLAVGIRKTLTIEVSREGAYDVSGTVYSSFQKDQTLVRAIMRVDVQCFQPTAFCLMSGVTA